MPAAGNVGIAPQSAINTISPGVLEPDRQPDESQIMNDAEIRRQPEVIRSIMSDTEAMPFNMVSEAKVAATVKLGWASGLMLVVRRAG